MTVIRMLDAADIAAKTGTIVEDPVIGVTVDRGGAVVGTGGVAWLGADRRPFGFVICDPSDLPPPRECVRLARLVIRSVRQAGEDAIYAFCDEKIAKANRFLRFLGFEPTDETIDGKTVWIFRGDA